jgi:hypothetical protein
MRKQMIASGRQKQTALNWLMSAHRGVHGHDRKPEDNRLRVAGTLAAQHSNRA